MVRGSPTPETPLVGRWRIVEMSTWDREAVDLIEPGFIEVAADGTGEFGFVAVRGQIDYRLVERDGRAGIEFTWEGTDEGDPVSGRGWATLIDEALIEGHVFFHLGDDSSFRAEPAHAADRADDKQ